MGASLYVSYPRALGDKSSTLRVPYSLLDDQTARPTKDLPTGSPEIVTLK